MVILITKDASSIVAIAVSPVFLLITFVAVLGSAVRNVGQLWQGASQRPWMRSSSLQEE